MKPTTPARSPRSRRAVGGQEPGSESSVSGVGVSEGRVSGRGQCLIGQGRGQSLRWSKFCGEPGISWTIKGRTARVGVQDRPREGREEGFLPTETFWTGSEVEEQFEVSGCISGLRMC